MDFKAMRTIKELFAHHRKFTPFQKVLIVSVFMGVILCLLRSWWCMAILFTYTVTLYSSVSVTKCIVICETLLPSDVVLSSYETIKNYALQAIYLCNTRCDPSEEDRVISDNEEVHDNSKKQLHKYGNEEVEILNAGTDSTSCKHMNTLTIEKHISSSLTSQLKLEKETHAVISLIKRDFFESWYSLFSKEVSALDDAESLFNHVREEMEGRLSHADSHKLFESILLLLKDHLHYVHQAKAMFKVQSKSRRKSQADTSTGTWSFAKPAVFTSIEDSYGSKVGLHPAVKNLEIEHVYQKSIIELLLRHLLWDDMLASKTLVCALKEILMCNILQNIIDLLCDATFLHEKIIKITSDEELCVSEVNIPTITISGIKPQEQDVHTILTNRFETHSKVSSRSQKETGETNSENKVIESEVNTSEDKVPIMWKEDLEVFPVSKKICFECNRLDSVDKDRISPRPHTCSLGTAPIFFIPEQESDRQSVNTISSTSSVDFKNCEDTYDEETEGEMPDLITCKQSITNDENQGTIDNDGKSEDISPRDRVLSSSSDTEEKPSSNIFPSLRFSFPNPLNFIERKRLSPSSEGATPDCEEVEIRRSKSHGDVITLTPDVLSESEENPSVFQDVRITGTETAKEPLSHNEYTLYIVEFEALYQSEESGLVHKTGMVKRRHSEFINLQSRLDDNSRYRKSMKDVKGPKKMLPSLPFGNMGKDIVDNRKQLLESFLKSLIAKPDLCNSKEVEQFLGYCGDGHIAFVRKIPENTGSRIDQRVVKTMSDVFDKIVEGFPSLPQQLPRIIPQFEQSEEKDVKPKMEVELSTDTDEIDLIYENEVEMGSKELTSVLEKFIIHKVTSGDMDNDTSLNNTTLGTSMLTWQDQQQQQGVSGNPTGHMTTSETQPPSIAIQNISTLECPLSNAALDLLTELLQRQDHWMCRDSVILAVKVLLGKGIQRLIEEKVEFFTSTDMILFYMKTLHETMWPDDELSTDQRPRYSDLQKEQIKLQATKCLIEFLPGILKFLVGNEESDMAVKEIMESLKYEKLNRHFWYTALDIVLEELFPEFNTQELQRKLSGSLNSS